MPTPKTSQLRRLPARHADRMTLCVAHLCVLVRAARRQTTPGVLPKMTNFAKDAHFLRVIIFGHVDDL